MSLRDALLNAGKIDEKQKRKADKKKRHAEHAEHKKKKKKKKKKSAEAAAPTPEQVAAQAAERLLRKLCEHIDEGVIEETRSTRRRFHFVAANNEIHFVQVSDIVGFQLENGKAAIVEDARQPTLAHVVVNRDAAIKVQALDNDRVRFFLNA